MIDPTTPLDTLAGLLQAAKAAGAATRPTAVQVPELGGHVYVARMAAAEWLDPEATPLPATATPAQRRGWNVARWVCDAEGARLVKPDNLEALDAFAALPWQAAHRILQAAGVTDEAAEKNA